VSKQAEKVTKQAEFAVALQMALGLFFYIDPFLCK